VITTLRACGWPLGIRRGRSSCNRESTACGEQARQPRCRSRSADGSRPTCLPRLLPLASEEARRSLRPRCDVPTSHTGRSRPSQPRANPRQARGEACQKRRSPRRPKSPEDLRHRRGCRPWHPPCAALRRSDAEAPSRRRASSRWHAAETPLMPRDRGHETGAAALVCRPDANIEATSHPDCAGPQPRLGAARLGRCPELSFPFSA
jgi:hypothetical protein